MRILLINDSSTLSGGAEIMSLSLRDALRDRGHEALLFSSRVLYGPSPVAADITCFGSTTPVRQLLRLANPSAYRELRRLLRQYRPEVVHVRMMSTQLSPLILPLLRPFPSIYHATWHEVLCPTGMKTLPNLSECRMPAGMACWRNGCVSTLTWPLLSLQHRLIWEWRDVFTRVVANSHFLARQLESAGWAQADVIWNGVPDVEPRPPLAEPPTIAFAGRLIPEKGAEETVRAWLLLRQDIPGLKMLVVGDGPQRLKIEQLVQDPEIARDIEFTGLIPRDVAERSLCRAWVQVVPSLCQESFGLVAAEAQVRGTAVVATRRGGLPEIVADGETGTLVENPTPEQLAMALRPLLTNRAWAEQLGQAGRKRARQFFLLENCVTRFLDVYARAIAEHSARFFRNTLA